MAIAGVGSDGNLTSGATGATRFSTSSDSKVSNNQTLDKDAFLQLLVAQMKNQDPLEPQDNTQMVQQMASFTQVEELQNMSSTMTQKQGFDLIGKMVSVNVVKSTGEEGIVEGIVDYVLKEGTDVFLGIAGNEYDINDLSSVIDN